MILNPFLVSFMKKEIICFHIFIVLSLKKNYFSLVDESTKESKVDLAEHLRY